MVAATHNKTKILGVALALFFLSLFLTAYSARNPDIARIGSAAVSEVLRPFQMLNQGMHTSATGVWDHYIFLVGVKEENDHLAERTRVLEAENSRLLELQSENDRLKQLLGVAEEHHVSGISASVIGYDPSNWVRAITVDRGTAHGIEAGMPVVEGNGVVGQVAAAGRSTSQILLISDHASGVDAIIQGSRARGVVEGTGSSTARWRYVSSEEAVSVGDRVITSGMDTIYPKGLLVGIVSYVSEKPNSLFQDIEVKPSVNFSKLETVLIINEVHVGNSAGEEKTVENTESKTENKKEESR